MGGGELTESEAMYNLSETARCTGGAIRESVISKRVSGHSWFPHPNLPALVTDTWGRGFRSHRLGRTTSLPHPPTKQYTLVQDTG